MLSGELIITENYENFTFSELFVNPWFNGFSILVGCFFAALCAFLTAVLLIGEAEINDRRIYVKKSRIATIVVIVVGLLLLCYGFIFKVSFVTDFIENPYAISLIVLSSILIYPLLKSIKQARKILSRSLAGLQVVLIMIAAFITHFPNLIIASNKEINLIETAATQSVIDVLGGALIVGGLIILPGLFHLFKSFKMIKVFER